MSKFKLRFNDFIELLKKFFVLDFHQTIFIKHNKVLFETIQTNNYKKIF